jgi:hypothetical protein
MTLSFFRRHRKAFMVLMFLSLISIVIFGWSGQAWERIQIWLGSHPSQQKVGSIAGRPVHENELQEFGFGLRAAGEAAEWLRRALEPQATTPEARYRLDLNTWGASAWHLLAPAADREKPDRMTVMTWVALYDEAKQRGLETSPAEVEARLKALQDLGLTAGVFREIVNRTAGGQRPRLLEAMRKDMTIRTYVGWLAEDLSGVTDPELRREFARMDERIKVRLEVLKAADYLPEVKEVPEKDLREQFEKYKKFLPGEGPEGYGYRVPDRVAIEYLVVDAAAFEEAAKPKVTDAETKEYYESRKDTEFVVKPEKPAEEKGEKKDEKKDEKKEEAKPPEKKYRPFEEVSEEIRKTLVHRAAAVMATELLYANAAEIRALKTPPDLRIWADGKRVRYEALQGFKTAAQLGETKGIGSAVRGNERLASAAVQVAGLVPASKSRLAVNEISDVYTDADGNAYVFRATAIDANHQAADLNEFRDKVMADVREAKAFDLARQRGTALMDAAAAKGLEAAAKDAKLKAPVETDWFPREHTVPYRGQFLTMPSALPEVGPNRMVVTECFRMAGEGRQRTMVTLADKREVVVAELVGRKEPREAHYARMRPFLAQMVGSRVAGITLRQALEPAAIQRRMAVVLDVPEERRGPAEPLAPVEDDSL